jgi:predicted RNase H-like HicB family nuclease
LSISVFSQVSPHLGTWEKNVEGKSKMLTIEVEREDDGRWLAEVVDLPGVLTYGQTRQEAVERTQALALRVLADRLEHGESVPDMGTVFAVVP